MRRKNIITIASSAIVFVIAVALLYRYLVPAPQGSGVMVIIPHLVNPVFNQVQLDALKSVNDYSQNISSSTLDGSASSLQTAQPAQGASPEVRN